MKFTFSALALCASFLVSTSAHAQGAAPKTETPKADATKADATKANGAKTDGAKADATKANGAKTDGAKADAKKDTKGTAAKDAKKATEAKDKKAGQKMNPNASYVTLNTTLGVIKMELDKEKADKSVEQITSLAKEGFYDGKVFHRVIKGFMIQGGGLDAKLMQHDSHKGKKIPTLKIQSENGLKNVRGTVALARTSDPNSATSQFFINLVDNGFLDYKPGNPGYTVIGKVVEGMDVVDKIAAVKTSINDVPETTIVIEKATVE